MIAFLIFLALMMAFLVGSACISMYLFLPNWTGYLQEHQLVTLNQEASIEERSGRRQKIEFSDMGMGACVRCVAGIGLGILAVMFVIVIMFASMPF